MRENRKHRLSDDDLFDAIGEAMRTNDWRLPVTEEEVARAEAGLAGASPARAAGLRIPPVPGLDPAAISPQRVIRLWDSEGMEDPLARAAREGGTLTPEVEAAMQRDRAKAEAAFDAAHTNHENDKA